MRSDSCDQKMSVKTTMFYIHSADSIIKFHTYQKSLMSYFFYMRKLLKLSCKVIAMVLCQEKVQIKYNQFSLFM